MNVIYSPVTGVIVSTPPGGATPEIHYLAGQEKWSDVESLYMLSSIQDWQVLDCVDNGFAPLVKRCAWDYWVSRAQSLIICLIGGASDSLTVEVLEHIENILQTRCSAEDILNRLLIAPLKDSRRAGALAKLALGGGFAAAASLLDRLLDLQVLLRRFVGTWLNLSPKEFVDLPMSRETLWQSLADSSVLARLLEADEKVGFTNGWAELVFNDMNTQGRLAIIRLGNLLADALHPTSVCRNQGIDQSSESDWDSDEFGARTYPEDFSDREAFPRALKQVNAIAHAIAEGKDARASQFLGELITEQLRSGTGEHLVKSLCNIAQKCAYMFRADFERQCLAQALSIAPNDAWTLIQLGNHLKRVGQFDEAIETLQRAANSRDSRIALSSIADVWCESGDYAKATEVYEGISGWQDIEEVRTGLADIRRHKGEFPEALSEYDTILGKWPGTDRATAGKAEIYKRLGRFDEAIALYDSLIYSPAVGEFGKLIYRLAKSTVLKQANRLDDAFVLADEVVSGAPFFMSARFHRAAILALLGEEARGLASLPQASIPRAFGTWITQYIQGLLLLKLKRYKKARKLLIDRLGSALLVSDNQTVLRLGAAFAHLCQDEIAPAHSVLGQVLNIRDYFTEHVYQVLAYHVSVAMNDKERMAEIARRLEQARANDEVVEKVLNALQKGDFSAARQFELELLLRIAV